MPQAGGQVGHGSYRARGVPIHLVGIEFAEEDHKIVAFESDTIAP